MRSKVEDRLEFLTSKWCNLLQYCNNCDWTKYIKKESVEGQKNLYPFNYLIFKLFYFFRIKSVLSNELLLSSKTLFGWVGLNPTTGKYFFPIIYRQSSVKTS